jgi:bacterioferritin-associated ferredoxin
MSKKAIVCRCEDITEDDVRKTIHEGYTDIEELRRKLRIGMGPCQGRVCMQLVRKILQQETGKRIPDEMMPTSRPPLVPISLGSLARKTKVEEGKE